MKYKMYQQEKKTNKLIESLSNKRKWTTETANFVIDLLYLNEGNNKKTTKYMNKETSKTDFWWSGVKNLPAMKYKFNSRILKIQDSQSSLHTIRGCKFTMEVRLRAHILLVKYHKMLKTWTRAHLQQWQIHELNLKRKNKQTNLCVTGKLEEPFGRDENG